MIEDIKKEIELFLVNDSMITFITKEKVFEILDKHAGKVESKETMFIYEGKEYDAFSLIYELANRGKLFLDHDNFEEEGVKVIL